MQWHLSRAGQVWGPYPWDALGSMAAGGQLLPDDLICTDGATWLPVTQFVSLAQPDYGGSPAQYEEPPSASMPPRTSTRAPLKPRTSKLSGYACWAGAAIILVAAGIRLGTQIDFASQGAKDSAAKIERDMLADGAPPDVAAKAAAGKPLDARDRERTPQRALLTAVGIPWRLRDIAAHKNLTLTIVSFLLALCTAVILAVSGGKRLRRANRERELAGE